MSMYEQDIAQTEAEDSSFYKIIVGYAPESPWNGLMMGTELGREGTTRILYYDELWFVATDISTDVLDDDTLSEDCYDELLDLYREGILDEAYYTMFFVECPVRVYSYINI